jgi:hypothetical protein
MPFASWILPLVESVAPTGVSPSPIAFHCHGGVGRTGVAIMAHMYLIQLLTAIQSGEFPNFINKDMNFLFFLLRIRLQRDSVQGPEQCAFLFHFVHCLLSLRERPYNGSRIHKDEFPSINIYSISPLFNDNFNSHFIFNSLWTQKQMYFPFSFSFFFVSFSFFLNY